MSILLEQINEIFFYKSYFHFLGSINLRLVISNFFGTLIVFFLKKYLFIFKKSLTELIPTTKKSICFCCLIKLIHASIDEILFSRHQNLKSSKIFKFF